MMGDYINKRMRKELVSLLFLSIVLAVKLIVSGMKDNMVILYGIHFYNTISLVLSILLFIAGILAAISGGMTLYGIIKRSRESQKKEPTPAQPEEKAILSVSGDMDPGKLYEILMSFAAKSDSESEKFIRCAMYLKEMDVYQEKLGRLLENNGATGLADSQDVLDKTEQYLCKEIRKVINLANVSDLSLSQDAGRISAALDACSERCSSLLGQVKEFLFAMAEFLNNQGEDDTTPETLEMYRKCILESIEKE